MQGFSEPTIHPSAPRFVLLIEPYDALASALGSTLKKFAPHYERRWVTSLSEAAMAAEQLRPILFIFDLDPPLPQSIAFVESLRTNHPGTHLLVIASNTTREFEMKFVEPGGIHFIHKSFTVPEFGAAVSSILAFAESGARQDGALHDLNSRDLIRFECAAGATAILELEKSESQLGEVHFFKGEICHARCGSKKGFEALVEILGWREARRKELVRPNDAPRTIHGPWMKVFREALDQAKTFEMASTSLPSEPISKTEHPLTKKTGPKVLIIEDTESLRNFVELTLGASDPELRIATSANGIDGVRQARVNAPDLVLLDFDLPDINGGEVCNRLLANLQTAEIPVVLMSGQPQKMEETAQRYRNVVGSIAKPFLSQALVALVKQIFFEKRRPQPASEPLKKTAGDFLLLGAPPNEPAPLPSLAENGAHAGNGHHPPDLSSISKQSEPAKIVELAKPIPAPTPRPMSEPRGGEVILGIALEVLCVEMSGLLQMGAIRARPSSQIVSLRLAQGASLGSASLENGFELSRVDLNSSGRIESVRLIPTRRPIQYESENQFEIGDVQFEQADKIHLKASGGIAMTFQLLGKYEIATVELSPSFEVAYLILKSRSEAVRVAFGSPPEQNLGATFNVASVRVDESARLSELLLAPVAS